MFIRRLEGNGHGIFKDKQKHCNDGESQNWCKLSREFAF